MFLLKGLKDFQNEMIHQRVRGPPSPEKGQQTKPLNATDVAANGGGGDDKPKLERPQSAMGSGVSTGSGRRRVKKQHSSRRNLTDGAHGERAMPSRQASRRPTTDAIEETSVVPQGPELIFLGDGAQVNSW